MKILRLVIIGIIAVGVISFWIFYEPSLQISDKEKFSKPIVEQVVNHTQLAKLFGIDNMNSSDYTNGSDIVDLYDWSKDGKFIIAGFHMSNKNYLVSIDPSGTMLEKLNIGQLDGFFPARISPSGNYVLFSGVKHYAQGAVQNLYLYDMVAKTMKQLTNNTEYDSGPHSTQIQDYGWTPNGNIIYNEENGFPVLTPKGSLSFSLWKADMTGKKLGQLCYSIYYFENPNFKSTTNNCSFAEMSISPDGKEISFADNPHIGIFHMDTNQTTIVANFSNDFGATTKWIPNSSAIVYDEFTDEHTHGWKLGIMSMGGSFNKIIYSTGWGNGFPVVSSDGKYIMFANTDNDIMRIRFG